MTDKEFERCMSAMAAGDRNSLRYVYDAYLKLIYAVVYDTIGQREEAEDVTSEFFIKLYSIAGSYKPGNGHRRWIVTIARNMAVDRIRKIDREALVDEIPETAQTGSMEEQVVNSVSLRRAMESLKPDEREVVDLKVAGGFTFREISEMVEKPMGTVTWLYNNAIKRLRRCRL